MRTQTPVELSILIVNYKTCALTLAAIDSVMAETRSVTYELIVVDNASCDGSAELIARHPAAPRLIALQENVGFARANNIAAQSANGRLLLLLNPDTVVLDRAIDRLVAFAKKNPSARIWGGRTLFADGSLNPASCWQRMTVWNVLCRTLGLTALLPNSEKFNGEALGGWRRDAVRQVDIVSGCFFLIEKELWDGLKGFDPMFFMYGEEADLCLRAHAFSARPMVTPEATIIHLGGASERVKADKMVRLLAAKMSLLNRHWSKALAPIGRLLLIGWPLSRAFATTIASLATGSRSLRTTAECWRLVWRRRDEWQDGYPARPRPVERRPQRHVPIVSRGAT